VACSAERESSHKLSELFQVCVPAAPEAKADIKIPVDVEFTSFTTSKGRIDFVFDQYPIREDISEASEKDARIVNPELDVRLIEHAPRGNMDYAYIRFAQPPGAVYPFAFAEVNSKDVRGERLLGMIQSLRRCNG